MPGLRGFGDEPHVPTPKAYKMVVSLSLIQFVEWPLPAPLAVFLVKEGLYVFLQVIPCNLVQTLQIVFNVEELSFFNRVLRNRLAKSMEISVR